MEEEECAISCFLVRFGSISAYGRTVLLTEQKGVITLKNTAICKFWRMSIQRSLLTHTSNYTRKRDMGTIETIGYYAESFYHSGIYIEFGS